MINEKIIVTPSPERLIPSLTSVGHTFVTAVADLVDNSIEAGASEISIRFLFAGKDSTVRISDNGKGMTPEAMEESMRFGTRRNYEETDLGKFGLGLKTASLSQCRCFTVASRSQQNETEVCAMSWDMDYLEKSKEWEVLKIQESNLDKEILKSLNDSTGTVVYWTKMKSIREYKDPNSRWATKSLVNMCRELETHLTMVFHRFLTGEGQTPQVTIKLNDNILEAWDPFARSEQYTKQMSLITISFDEDSISGEIQVQPFILPTQKQFSSMDAFDKTGGPNKWNLQQGFYIYRANRMIQSGGWCGIRVIEEHMKLARAALHFPPSMDDAFNIDVAKMNVSMPPTLRKSIKRNMQPVWKVANDTYRYSGKSNRSSSGQSKNQNNIQERNGSNVGGAQTQFTVSKKLTFDDFATLLKGVAFDDELPVLNRIIEEARTNLGEE